LATLALGASVSPARAAAGHGVRAPGRGPRDRQRFADVRAVGVSPRTCIRRPAASRSTIDCSSWLPPLSRDGGLEDQQITFMTGDPTEDAIWLGVPGAVLVYRPQTEQLQRTILTGVPEFIVFDRTPGGDAYVRASGQWTRVSRIGMTTPIAGPPAADKLFVPQTLNDVYARFPALAPDRRCSFATSKAIACCARTPS
jgi:hypothetical protein